MKPSAFRLIAALAAVVALALFALSYTSKGESRSEHGVGSWQWERALSGSRVAATSLTRRMLDESLDRGGWTSLHEVAAAGSMSDRVSLLAVRSRSGDVCLGVSAFAFVGEFHCVSNSAVRDEALMHFASGGGAQLGFVDRISVVGIARSDVARVVVTTPSGQHDLQLNSARGFAYHSAAHGLPSSISAYGADGAVIAEYFVGM